MVNEYDVQAMVQAIQTLKQNVETLKDISGGIVTVDRNVNRISASIRVLELAICDVTNLLLEPG